jgi:hypothetical protein
MWIAVDFQTSDDAVPVAPQETTASNYADSDADAATIDASAKNPIPVVIDTSHPYNTLGEAMQQLHDNILKAHKEAHNDWQEFGQFVVERNNKFYLSNIGAGVSGSVHQVIWDGNTINALIAGGYNFVAYNHVHPEVYFGTGTASSDPSAGDIRINGSIRSERGFSWAQPKSWLGIYIENNGQTFRESPNSNRSHLCNWRELGWAEC